MNQITQNVAKLILEGKRILRVRAEAERYAVISVAGVADLKVDTGATTRDEFQRIWQDAATHLRINWDEPGASRTKKFGLD